MKSDWNFDTIRSTAAMGTFRSMAKDLVMPPTMEADDDDMSVYEDDHRSIDTSGATNWSGPLVGGGLGFNPQGAHSTVVIKPPRPAPETDTPLLASESSSPDQTPSGSPAAPPEGAPPAYTGSIRSKRRASYAERTSVRGAGTVLNEADLGTGVDTIRPVKRVDPVGSLRISAEFVGNLRREGSSSTPTSPTKHTRAASEAGQAGKAMVDEVVLPILRKVCAQNKLYASVLIVFAVRLFEMTWMHMRSNLSACYLEAFLSSRKLILNWHTMLSSMSCVGSMSMSSRYYTMARS